MFRRRTNLNDVVVIFEVFLIARHCRTEALLDEQLDHPSPEYFAETFQERLLRLCVGDRDVERVAEEGEQPGEEVQDVESVRGSGGRLVKGDLEEVLAIVVDVEAGNFPGQDWMDDVGHQLGAELVHSGTNTT